MNSSMQPNRAIRADELPVVKAFAVYHPSSGLLFNTIRMTRENSRRAFMATLTGGRSYWPRFASQGYSLRAVWITRTPIAV